MHYTLHYIHDIYNTYISCSVVQSLSHVQLFMTPWTEANQPSLSPWICSNSCPLSWWCYLTISSSAAIFSFCLQSFPASGFFPMSQLFASGGQGIGASASASVLPMYTQGWFPLGLLVWFPGCLRDSQESSPRPQFKNINSLALSLFYGPTVISVLDYGKKHSFDYMDLCQQSDVFDF